MGEEMTDIEKRLTLLVDKIDKNYKANKIEIDSILRSIEADSHKEPDIVGCYIVKPQTNSIYLVVELGDVVERGWYDSSMDKKYFNSGNCYPLSMRQHLENAIECREILMADENVVLEHKCEYGREYAYIVIEQHQHNVFKANTSACDIERRRYNFPSDVYLDEFLNKWHDKLISMFLVGWL